MKKSRKVSYPKRQIHATDVDVRLRLDLVHLTIFAYARSFLLEITLSFHGNIVNKRRSRFVQKRSFSQSIWRIWFFSLLFCCLSWACEPSFLFTANAEVRNPSLPLSHRFAGFQNFELALLKCILMVRFTEYRE